MKSSTNNKTIDSFCLLVYCEQILSNSDVTNNNSSNKETAMSKSDELVKIQLQKRFKSPVGVRENEETLYANIAHEPLMLDQVRQIEVLQMADAIDNNIKYKNYDAKKDQ